MVDINEIIRYAKNEFNYTLSITEANQVLAYSEEFDDDFENVVDDYVQEKLYYGYSGWLTSWCE